MTDPTHGPGDDVPGPRHAGGGPARHRGGETAAAFRSAFRALGGLALDGMRVAARATDLDTGEVVLAVDDHVALPAAGLGRVLLLIELSARMTAGDLSPLHLVDRLPEDEGGSAGLWRHLVVPSLPATDLGSLVGATGDAAATNALLRLVGLGAVRARAESLGLRRTALLDLARGSRGPDDAPQLSVGSARELASLFSSLVHGEVVDEETSTRVVGWLALNTDRSLVAASFGLDPLVERGGEHGIVVVDCTGVDAGVRAEAGVLRGPRGAVAYAVMVHFDDADLPARLAVRDALGIVGLDLLEHVH
ncbi:serine hydrolase [Clavibacter sp. CFBP 8614]|uniref:serine hydrolase n=1 Tax=unclassified Clavibacter TaxID=2626594 RepID=UPI0040422083